MESRICSDEEGMRELTHVYGGIKKASSSAEGLTCEHVQYEVDFCL